MQTGFIAPLAAVLGLFAGIVLARLAKEELQEGRKYIEVFRKLLLLLIFISAIGYAAIYENMLNTVLGIAFGFIALKIKKERYDYIFLGIIATATVMIQSQAIIFLISALIFLYGLPYGSMMKHNLQNIAAHSIAFFLPFLLLIMPGLDISSLLGFGAMCLAFQCK